MNRVALVLLLAGCAQSRPAPVTPVRQLSKPVDGTPRAGEAMRVFVVLALETYRAHCFAYPRALAGLFETPAGISEDWRGPYLEGRPPVLDPWGTEWGYMSDGASFKLTSAGPDGTIGTGDDIGGNP